MRISHLIPIALTTTILSGCTDVLTAESDFHTMPDTGAFVAIPGLPPGDIVLVSSFDANPTDINSDSTDPITGTKSYAIPETTRFQVFNTPPSGGQVWLPTTRQEAKFRSRAFAKERINGSTSRFKFKYRTRDVGVQVETTEPLSNSIGATVGEGGNFATSMRIMTETSDEFPTPNVVFGPKDLFNANFYDQGGPCVRISIDVIRGLLDSRWNGDERDITISAPIGEVLSFQLTALGPAISAQVSGANLVDLGTTPSGWETACTVAAVTVPNVTIGGRILDQNGQDQDLSDYLFPASTQDAAISVVAQQGITISSYINAPGESLENSDFTLTADRPYSSLDDIKVKVARP